MTQTGGLAILFAWLMFAALLSVLAYFVLRTPADPVSEGSRRTGETDGETDSLSSTDGG